LNLPKSTQISPNLINFTKKVLLGISAASPAPTALFTYISILKGEYVE